MLDAKYVSLNQTLSSSNISTDTLQLDFIPGHFFPKIIEISVVDKDNNVVEYIQDDTV